MMLKIVALAFVGMLSAALIILPSIYVWRNHGPDYSNLANDITYRVRLWQDDDKAEDVVVAVVKAGESRTFSFGPGLANAQTSFQIGSITKVFTTLILQRLVDDGILRMNTMLKDVMGERYPLSPKVAGVTLLQLATHTSGFPSLPDPIKDGMLKRIGEGDFLEDPFNVLSRDDVLEYLSDISAPETKLA